MIGRRRFPCHEGSVKVKKVEGVHERRCPVCHREWVVLVEKCAVMPEVLKMTWIPREKWHEDQRAAV